MSVGFQNYNREEMEYKLRTMNARLEAYAMLVSWGVDDPSYGYLIKLLGHGESFDIQSDMTEADIGLCALLCGPHGWAIYKMLLIKRGMVSHD